MNIEEARQKIGFKFVASVYAAIRSGGIRCREDGSVVIESVDTFIEKRAKNAERTELFLKDDSAMTLAERKKLVGKIK